MSINRIILNETSYFGTGSRTVLADEIKKRGFKKAFIVTDNDLVKFGVVAQVTSVLEDGGIPFQIFSEVKQNPTVKQVKAGGAEFAASGADVIVAIGGGSPIDTAKAIAVMPTILNLKM